MVEMATLSIENCYTKVITPPIFKLATKSLTYSIYEEFFTIYYVLTPFCWPPPTIPLRPPITRPL